MAYFVTGRLRTLDERIWKVVQTLFPGTRRVRSSFRSLIVLRNSWGVISAERLLKVVRFAKRFGIGFYELVTSLVTDGSPIVFVFLFYNDYGRGPGTGNSSNVSICFSFLDSCRIELNYIPSFTIFAERFFQVYWLLRSYLNIYQRIVLHILAELDPLVAGMLRRRNHSWKSVQTNIS